MTKMKFKCMNCSKTVSDSRYMGTENRNHCPFCLWSEHVDIKPGDRANSCHGMMKPMGLAFKKEKPNKYKKEEKGELMIIHQCQKCGIETKNRIAGDDSPEAILAVVEEKDRKEVERQLFGKK